VVELRYGKRIKDDINLVKNSPEIGEVLIE
jgi:hypothetical protein